VGTNLGFHPLLLDQTLFLHSYSFWLWCLSFNMQTIWPELPSMFVANPWLSSGVSGLVVHILEHWNIVLSSSLSLLTSFGVCSVNVKEGSCFVLYFFFYCFSLENVNSWCSFFFISFILLDSCCYWAYKILENSHPTISYLVFWS